LAYHLNKSEQDMHKELIIIGMVFAFVISQAPNVL
jgi:hypothetical protein